MLRTVTVILLLALPNSACAGLIHDDAPADWPQLKIHEHRLGFLEVQKRCRQYLTHSGRLVSFGVVGGCAEVRFAENRCDIFITDDASEGVIDHEYDHCLGKDHPGDSTLRDAWINHKAAHGPI